MKTTKLSNLSTCGLLLLLLLSGCKRSAPQTDEEGSRGGTEMRLCGFKAGSGVFVSGETRRAIGLATMDVPQKALPQTIRSTARVFALGKATLLVDAAQAQAIKAGQRVRFDHGHEGEVVAVNRASEMSSGTAEVIVRLPNEALNPGVFATAILQIERSKPLPAIPEASVLSTATGNYVYVLNGDHFLRTAVKRAGSADGWLTVSNGLLEGDVVVTNGVQALWCIELQATKGGYACCAVTKKE